MVNDLGMVSAAALLLGSVHTLLGPDHYLPFVAMARAGRWSLRKTMIVTLLCGIGHVASSFVLALIGIAFGIAVFRLESVDSVRGDVASWLLIGFGLAYFSWGLVRAVRHLPHTHLHAHEDGTWHAHPHQHEGSHLHAHARVEAMAVEAPAVRPEPLPVAPRAAALTPWVLFTIFLFGPCEPLIPLLMYPATRADLWGVAWITSLFGVATLVTMSVVVFALHWGTHWIASPRLNRFGHAAAGLVVLACGLAIKAGL